MEGVQMAEIRYFRNPFGEDFETKEYDFSKSLIENIDGFKTDVTEMVECYDTETGETYFVPLEDDEEHVIVTVNGKSIDENYKVQSNDVLIVVYIPLSQRWEAGLAGFGGGTAVGIGFAYLTFVIAGIVGMTVAPWVYVGIIGAFAVGGIFAGTAIWDHFHPDTTTTIEDKKGEQRPDIRGAENESIAGNPYPFTIGRHLMAPRIIGDPYTEYSGSKGENAYVRVLYNAGYAPVKLTDFKLGDIFLAYNRNQGSYNGTPTGGQADTRPVMLNGILYGHSRSGDDADTGDILDYWKNNDITVELIQPNPNFPVNYGTVYPNKAVEQEINATPLFVCDELLEQTAQVVYKGASFPQNFRNNGVYFTEACPMKFTINLNAQNGLYASRSKTAKDEHDSSKTITSTEYKKLPLWYCIQWRPYNRGNNSSDSNGGDYSAWHNIKVWNGNQSTSQDPSQNVFKTYNSSAMAEDVAFHKGNKITVKPVTFTDKEYLVLSDIMPRMVTETKTGSLLSIYNNGSFKSVRISDKEIYAEPAGHTVYIGKIKSDDSVDNVFYDETTKTLYIDAFNEITNSTGKINGDLRSEFIESKVSPASVTIYNAHSLSGGSGTTQTVTVECYKYLRNYYIGSKQTINSPTGYFGGKDLVDFSYFSGEDSVGQVRLRATVDLREPIDYINGDPEQPVYFDFKELMNPDNSMKSIEIRVLRISASYINEAQSTSDSSDNYPKFGAYSYSDVITVDTIVTEPFDEGWYREHGEVIPQKVQSEDDMKKFAYIAIKAKADVTNIQAQLKKLTCMSESFSPVWDKVNKKWLPEGVERVKNYYGYIFFDTTNFVVINTTSLPDDFDTELYVRKTGDVYTQITSQRNPVNGETLYKITSDNYAYRGEKKGDAPNIQKAVEVSVVKSMYEKGRGEGKNWYCEEVGSNYGDLIKQKVFPSNNSRRDTHNNVARDYMWEDDEAARYNDSTSASSFILACVGQQNGRWADGYEDLNLLSLGEWWEDCQAVEDGSTYEYNDGVHNAGDTVVVKYEANGFITSSQKKETLLKDIAATGRAVLTYDEAGKIKVVMDKPVDYAEGVINSQNCIEESHAYSFADVPPGLRISYADENDGYEQSSMYCWADGYNITNYRGTVEACSLKYVTNPYHAHNLGRYILACRVMKKQVMTAKVGREGRLFPLGAVVLVQSDVILLGEGSARIQEVLTKEVSGQTVVFGIVTDNVFDFKNKSDGTHSIKGVQILQPKQYGKSKVVTLRLKEDGDSESVGNITYTQKSGKVNLFLFDGGQENVTFDFKTGDIVMLGTLNKISQKFRVIKVKPEEKGSFTMTLNLYDEALYNYGAKLPVFKVNTTRPPVIDTMPPLYEVASTVAEQDKIVNKAITLTVNDTPDILDIGTDVDEITITTDRNAKAVTDQHSIITIHCKKNDTDIPFIIGVPDKPTGWNYSVDPSTKQITFTVPKETEVTKGTISIPVYYNITQDTVIYWDENNNVYTDGTDTYNNLPLTDYTLKTLYVTYSGVEGGKSLGPINNLTTLANTNANINDYFVWSGDNAAQTDLVVGGYLYTARLYRCNGSNTNPKWETDEDISHNSAQLGEIIKAANVVLTSEQLQDNNIQAWTFIKNLAVSNLFVDFMVANTAVIQSLTSGVISTGSLISTEDAEEISEEEVAASKNDLAQKLGYASYADMRAKTDPQNPNYKGTIIDGNYLRTGLIDVDALFAKNIKIKNNGSIESQNYIDIGEAEILETVEYYSVCNDKGGTALHGPYNTYEEASEYVPTGETFLYILAKLNTKQGNTYYTADRTTSDSIQGYYYLSDEDNTPAQDDWILFNSEIPLPVNKIFLYIKGGTSIIGGSVVYQLTQKENSGFKIQSDGNAVFNNATIEAADFKLNVEAGNVEQLTLPISKPDIAQTQFDYEFKPMGTGSFRIKFNYTIQEHISESVGNDLWIYINGVICEFEDTTPGTYTYTQDINFNAGDVIKISVYYAYDRLVLDPTIINSAKVFLATDSTMFKTMSNCALVSYWTSGHR